MTHYELVEDKQHFLFMQNNHSEESLVSEDQSNLGIWCYQHILHFLTNNTTNSAPTHTPQIHNQKVKRDFKNDADVKCHVSYFVCKNPYLKREIKKKI